MPDESSMRVNDVLDGLSVHSNELRAIIYAINDIRAAELLGFGPIPINRYMVVPLKKQSDAVRYLENILDQDLRGNTRRIVTSCALTGACLSIQKWIRENGIEVRTVHLDTPQPGTHPGAQEYGVKIRRLPSYSSSPRTVGASVLLCEVELIVPMLSSLFEISLY